MKTTQEKLTKIESVIRECNPELLKPKDGSLVYISTYSTYIDESGDDVISNDPDDCSVGVILNGEVIGTDYDISAVLFNNGVYTEGVDENGAIDVYEYLEARVENNIELQHILRAIGGKSITDRELVSFIYTIYDLTKPYHLQSDEFISCLYGVLVGE